MTISVRLSEEDTKLIKAYAQMKKITLSELVRNAIMEKIEDEYDLKCYYEAIKEFKEDSKTYTMEEIKKELNL